MFQNKDMENEISTIYKICFAKLSIKTSPAIHKTSVIRQKSESKNGCFKERKNAKFSEKRTFLTP